MTETSYIILGTAVRVTLKRLKGRLNNEWHGEESYNRITYRIQRLERFKDFLELKQDFDT